MITEMTMTMGDDYSANGNDEVDNGDDDDIDDFILLSCLPFMWKISKKLCCGVSVFSHMKLGSE